MHIARYYKLYRLGIDVPPTILKCFQYSEDIFGKLKQAKCSYYRHIDFYVDDKNEIYLENHHDGNLLCIYSLHWKILKNDYNLLHVEVMELVRLLVQKYFNIILKEPRPVTYSTPELNDKSIMNSEWEYVSSNNKMNITRQYKLYRLGVNISPTYTNIFHYLDDLFTKLTKAKRHNYPYTFFYIDTKNKIVYMEDDGSSGFLWCDNKYMWRTLLKFGFNHEETQNFVKVVADKYFGLGHLTPENKNLNFIWHFDTQFYTVI